MHLFWYVSHDLTYEYYAKVLITQFVRIIESHSSKKLEKGRVCNSERNKKVQTLKMRINHCFVAGNSFEYGNNGKVQIRKSSIHFIFFGLFLTSLKKFKKASIITICPALKFKALFVLLVQQYRIYRKYPRRFFLF